MRDSSKFKSLVHYVVSRRCNSPDTLGAVKLNKIMWLSDLTSYYERGKPITTSRYIKRAYGPVPASIMPVLRDLEREGAITVTDAPIHNKRKTEYRVHVPMTSTDFLAPEELAIVNGVIDHICDEHTAKSISEASHDHIWMAAADGEEIPLFTVFSRPGKVSDTDKVWAQMKLEEEFA